MKCAACGHENRRSAKVCAKCGAGLKSAPRTPGMAVAHGLIWAAAICISVTMASLLFYRVYYWVAAWQMENYYQRNGVLEPSVEETVLDSGLVGHSIAFFGEDGDHIFIQELRKSYQISGGLVRLDIPDSYWFSSQFSSNPQDVETAESAIVTLTPILYTEKGDQRALPLLTMEIEPPQSPLTMITPEGDFEQVNTSTYLLSFQVVPGSTVLVGNDDVTDVVNFEGLVEVNIEVYPQGDNPVSILVSTPNHKQTRMDVNLYRPYQDINLEPSLTVPKTTNLKTVKITGKVDPTAFLSVDTPYEEGSIILDDDGSFSFNAIMQTIGNNTVTFRASQEGKTDSVVSVVVYYVPSLNTYSRSAWAMDYPALSQYYEIWNGRVFRCDGVIVDVWVEDEEQTMIMDVSEEEGQHQYLVLTNLSSIGTPEIGSKYTAWADVSGHEFYADKDCPKLICRYMSLASS